MLREVALQDQFLADHFKLAAFENDWLRGDFTSIFEYTQNCTNQLILKLCIFNNLEMTSGETDVGTKHHFYTNLLWIMVVFHPVREGNITLC